MYIVSTSICVYATIYGEHIPSSALMGVVQCIDRTQATPSAVAVPSPDVIAIAAAPFPATTPPPRRP